MNLTDLTDLMRQRAEPMPELVPDARVAGVQAKVKSRQRRRAGAAVACVVLVILGAVYAFVTPSERSSEPAVRSIQGFPEYAYGARMISAATGTLPDRMIKFTFVPKTLDLKIFLRCDVGPEQVLKVQVEFNGRGTVDAICGQDLTEALARSTWADRAVVVGRPTEVVLTVQPEDSAVPMVRVPDSGTFGIAIGEALPTAEYPYPPRPATLRPLGSSMFNELAAVSSTNPGGGTFAWPGSVSLEIRLNTPGKLEVRFDDAPVATCESWDYQVRICRPGLSREDSVARRVQFRDGQSVRVTAVGERVTGEWSVVVHM